MKFIFTESNFWSKFIGFDSKMEVHKTLNLGKVLEFCALEVASFDNVDIQTPDLLWEHSQKKMSTFWIHQENSHLLRLPLCKFESSWISKHSSELKTVLTDKLYIYF